MAAREVASIRAEVRALADPARAEHHLRFFRTGPGEYGEGDRFLGLTVPQLRTLARKHRGGSLDVAFALLRSEWHEERLLALLLLVDAHTRANEATRATILDAYLAHTAHIDNWDLVDASARQIVGPHVASDDLSLLERLARSPNVWERRIAMVATHHHIMQGDTAPTLRVAGLLLDDRHDLIHKATGWMLREAAKRDQARVEAFLRRHVQRVPRTTLRYAIERFPEALRREYLALR